MERYFVILLACVSLLLPLLMVTVGDDLNLVEERDVPVLDHAQEVGLARDPVRQARVDMYLSEALSILDDPAQRARACALLQQARKAASLEAKKLHRERCAP